ncbi:MAG: hypothetical protein ABI597_14180 [Gammaproteobacteria bacterium]
MPEAVIFHYQGKVYTVFFSRMNAVLPVKLKNGDCKLVAWGRRENENSEMPLGGWARSTAIKNNQDQRWNMYSPKPVQISIDKFMEKNFEGKACWYEITKGQCIQGLLAKEQDEYRLYIVTVDPEDLTNCHYRWPHIITCSIKLIDS